MGPLCFGHTPSPARTMYEVSKLKKILASWLRYLGDTTTVYLTPIYPVIWPCCSSLVFTSWVCLTILLSRWPLSKLLPTPLSQKSPPTSMLASLAWPIDLPWIVTVKHSDSWLPLWHTASILYDRLVRIISLAPHLKHCSVTSRCFFVILYIHFQILFIPSSCASGFWSHVPPKYYGHLINIIKISHLYFVPPIPPHITNEYGKFWEKKLYIHR